MRRVARRSLKEEALLAAKQNRDPNWKFAEKRLKKYVDGINRRFEKVGSSKRIGWEMSAENGKLHSKPRHFKPRIETVLYDKNNPHTAIAAWDITYRPGKIFPFEKYKKAFGDIDIWDISYVAIDPNRPGLQFYEIKY